MENSININSYLIISAFMLLTISLHTMSLVSMIECTMFNVSLFAIEPECNTKAERKLSLENTETREITVDSNAHVEVGTLIEFD